MQPVRYEEHQRHWKALGVSQRIYGSLSGSAVGVFCYVAADMLGVNWVLGIGHFALLIYGAIGAALGASRGRVFLKVAAGAWALALVVVGLTPISGALLRWWQVYERPRPADAVIVLSANVFTGEQLSGASRERLATAYKLMHAGFAREIVITRPDDSIGGSWLAAAQADMAAMGLDWRLSELGPVRNTHDEAAAVAGAARRRGWRSVVVVTHAWHMRRALAVFRASSVVAVGASCADGRYDATRLKSPSERWAAFRDVLHELIGFRVYKARGWLVIGSRTSKNTVFLV